MILIAFVCDGLDGRVARLSRTSSQFGVEYDSLSDVVAFGVAPAGIAYCWSLKSLGTWGVVIAGMFVICAALRLARFNVQTGSTDKRRFVGLPVPGAAAMIAGCVLAYSYFEFESPHVLVTVMAPLTVALAGLMISRVPYPSFKTINLRQHAPVELVAVMLLALAFLFAMPQFTFFMLATAYVASGPFLMLRGERSQALAPLLGPPTDDLRLRPRIPRKGRQPRPCPHHRRSVGAAPVRSTECDGARLTVLRATAYNSWRCRPA